MCGICGIYNYSDREPADIGLLYEMQEAMHHRGPDDDGRYLDGELGLAMRRLSIIDLEGGAQPIANEDRTVWVISNGEIYNFRELRRELEGDGHIFVTRSDTEVIVHAYEQWGFGALARLNGMFGLAIWDERNRTLLVARDPYGIKPVYFWNDGRTLAFASEVRALLCHPRVDRKVDLGGLSEFLAYTYVPAPATAFAGIKKLLPGHAVRCTDEGIELRRFHEAQFEDLSDESEAALVARLEEGIEAAVRRQMVADVPVGVMLSGGLDSTAVAAISAEAAPYTIDTFTVGFDGDFDQNELDKARAAAARIGSRHHQVVIAPEEYLEFLPTSIWHLEEPVATASTLAFYKVCQLASEHVKLVLTGQGADEPFGGYARYLGEHHGKLYRRMPRALRENVVGPMVRRFPRNEQLKRAVGSLGIADDLQRMRRIYSVLDDTIWPALMREPGAIHDGRDDSIELWFRDVEHLDPVSRMMYVDSRTSLSDNLLLYSDKMSMAVSLEARVPFLDLELMRLAESIPARLKIRGLTRKKILKRAVGRWAGPQPRTLKKVGFKAPVDQWFRSDLRNILEERLLDSASACRTYFRPEIIQRMLREHASGRHDFKRPLFSLLTFEIWHEQFIGPTTWPPANAWGTSSRGDPAAAVAQAGLERLGT